MIAEYAVLTEGFERPCLLLEETGWGRSNEKTMTDALEKLGVAPPGVTWFNWNLGLSGARVLLRSIAESGADVIFLVANAPEGKTFASAMVELPEEQRLPLRSHWGITGGDFPEAIGPDIRREIDLAFIQTRFSFVSHPDHPLGKKVLREARALFPGVVEVAEDIQAPTGFIHAYDLTRLLISAVQQAGLTGDIVEDRKRVRDVLEDLKAPVAGLVKTYRKPFARFDEGHPDAHEALRRDDFVMARYGERGQILLLQP